MTLLEGIPPAHLSVGKEYLNISRSQHNLVALLFLIDLGIFFLQSSEGGLGPFRLGKLAWQTPKLGKFVIHVVHNYVIFGQYFLPITHTIAIKFKENFTMYRLCVLTE